MDEGANNIKTPTETKTQRLENLYNRAHKATNAQYRAGYEQIAWEKKNMGKCSCGSNCKCKGKGKGKGGGGKGKS